MSNLHVLSPQPEPEYFKVIPSTQNNLPALENYQQLLKILKNQTYLYVDFNKKDQSSLILLQKTETPTKQFTDDHDEDDHHEMPQKQIESLGNQYILDMNNLSRPSYKMVKYVSEGKKLMNKKKSIDQLENNFLLSLKKDPKNNFVQTARLKIGPGYRKLQEKNRKLQYSNKIGAEKLEEYLESKEYRKVERKLQKSEKELEKYVLSMRELKEKEKEVNFEMSSIEGKGTVSQLDLELRQSGKGNRFMNFVGERKRSISSMGKSEMILRKRGGDLRLPKLRFFNELLESTLKEK